MTKDQIDEAANTIANLIVNEQNVHRMIHEASCRELELDPNGDHSELFEQNERMESRYYAAGAKYWSAVTIRAAVLLDGMSK